jgi:hypothetical protein
MHCGSSPSKAVLTELAKPADALCICLMLTVDVACLPAVDVDRLSTVDACLLPNS